MARIPLPPYPNGWFGLCYADELLPGAVKPLHVLGRDLVAFRADDGAAYVLDAFCPHLGAHLGHGGTVDGATVRCPFHGWRWDGASGRCVEVPYAKKIPPKAALRTWPVLEQNDLLYVYHHVDGAAPDWEPDRIPEIGQPDYYRWASREWVIRSHPQEVMENGVDYAHFITLHGWQTVAMRWTPNGVRYTLEIDVDTEAERQAATAANATTVNSYNSGPGFLFTRVTGPMRGIAMNMLTPLDPERLRVQHAYYAHRDVPEETVRAFFTAYEADWHLDFPIWDHKVHHLRPVLTEGERDVGRFRRWYRQFYTDGQIAAAGGEGAA
jgi:phenylpropionate dioxygenase-like ring-hydroxylating dioxygenase large terminal subunit